MSPGSPAALRALLHLADTALPVGGFAHSDGVEAAGDILAEGDADLAGLLAAHAALSVAPGDGAFVRAGHRAAEEGGVALLETAREDLAARVALLQRVASLSVGASFLRVARQIATGDEQARLAGIAAALGNVTPRATVFGAVLWTLGAEAGDAAEAHLYVTLAGMANAAVRLSACGATEAQRALRRAMLAAPSTDADEDHARGFASPLLEIAAMHHETRDHRLFAS
ncbi:MAG: urease accessory protein [Solirubrobacteraceae bacterium]|nr:urease accessory protein [Solirubrobacteraceae bacterium]